MPLSMVSSGEDFLIKNSTMIYHSSVLTKFNFEEIKNISSINNYYQKYFEYLQSEKITENITSYTLSNDNITEGLKVLKSTSGIKHFSNVGEWEKAIDKLDATLKQYNIDNGTSYKFDAARLKGMISNSDDFLRLQNEALAIRDADAMSQIVKRNGGTLMQDGTQYNSDVLYYLKEYQQ